MSGAMKQGAGKKSTTARDLGLMALASGIGVFVGLGITELILACMSYAGYGMSGTGTNWLRVIVLAMCVGWAQRYFVRRFGIKI